MVVLWLFLSVFVDSWWDVRHNVDDINERHQVVDIHLEIDSEDRLRTKLYVKRDDFNFLIVNFPFICSNIPAAPACGAYTPIWEMMLYSPYTK
jgi:hypothetical protein